jgi:DNA-binding NtrC family response regulator
MATILVIDDEVQINKLLNKMLVRDGHQVHTAKDGVEGLRSFNQFKPDLVITDIVMPKKDGFEVIKELLEFHPMLPIIAISGAVRDMTAGMNLSSIEALGVAGALQKPFALQQMRDILEVVLN